MYTSTYTRIAVCMLAISISLSAFTPVQRANLQQLTKDIETGKVTDPAMIRERALNLKISSKDMGDGIVKKLIFAAEDKGIADVLNPALKMSVPAPKTPPMTQPAVKVPQQVGTVTGNVPGATQEVYADVAPGAEAEFASLKKRLQELDMSIKAKPLTTENQKEFQKTYRSLFDKYSDLAIRFSKNYTYTPREIALQKEIEDLGVKVRDRIGENFDANVKNWLQVFGSLSATETAIIPNEIKQLGEELKQAHTAIKEMRKELAQKGVSSLADAMGTFDTYKNGKYQTAINEAANKQKINTPASNFLFDLAKQFPAIDNDLAALQKQIDELKKKNQVVGAIGSSTVQKVEPGTPATPQLTITAAQQKLVNEQKAKLDAMQPKVEALERQTKKSNLTALEINSIREGLHSLDLACDDIGGKIADLLAQSESAGRPLVSLLRALEARLGTIRLWLDKQPTPAQPTPAISTPAPTNTAGITTATTQPTTQSTQALLEDRRN